MIKKLEKYLITFTIFLCADAQLEAICFDLLAAGPETSSAFISFCVMFASLHPQWQADLQTEIDEYLAVSGNDLPFYEDRNRYVALSDNDFRSASCSPRYTRSGRQRCRGR